MLKTAPEHVLAQFDPLVPLIAKIVGDRSFPKRPAPRFDFLVDSVAARGDISSRRFRDICDGERANKSGSVTASHYAKGILC